MGLRGFVEEQLLEVLLQGSVIVSNTEKDLSPQRSDESTLNSPKKRSRSTSCRNEGSLHFIIIKRFVEGARG